MTTFRLRFDKRARKEFDKLGATIRDQFKAKLGERIRNPRVEADRLHDMPDCYRIKLRSAGYRLIYQVRDSEIQIIILGVGKRDSKKRDAYDRVTDRLANIRSEE